MTIIFLVGHICSFSASVSTLGLSAFVSQLLILWAHHSRHRAAARHLFASDCRHGLVEAWSLVSGRFDLPNFRRLLHNRHTIPARSSPFIRHMTSLLLDSTRRYLPGSYILVSWCRTPQGSSESVDTPLVSIPLQQNKLSRDLMLEIISRRTTCSVSLYT